MEKKNLFIKNNDLINCIHNGFSTISNKNKKKIIKNILTDEYINELILKYEFFNYTPNEAEQNIESLKNILNDELKKYTFLSKMESNDWLIHDLTSSKYELVENEILFENSIQSVDIHDIETLDFLKQLKFRMEKIATNFNIKYKFIDAKRLLVNWVVIICSLKH